MLSHSSYMYEYAPSLERYLKNYPQDRPPGVAETLFWSEDDLPGLKPTLTITHEVVYTPPDLPGTSLIASKLLYADHFLDGALDLRVVVDQMGTGAGNPAGIYLVVVRRLHFDDLSGPFNVRGRVISELTQPDRDISARCRKGPASRPTRAGLLPPVEPLPRGVDPRNAPHPGMERGEPAEEVSMGVIPLSDSSRRPARFPVMTASLIAVNALVFLLELIRGEAFVTAWSVIPHDIVAGHGLITILSAMFMHASWSHILGNMIFLWAFGPAVEDLMNPRRYVIFLPAPVGSPRRLGAGFGPTRSPSSQPWVRVGQSLP